MLKILKYLKPYLGSVFLIVVLLFGQAWCELTLPDYMQTIVNTGIQNNGIENGVYAYIRESTLQGMIHIGNDQEKKLIQQSYTLLKSKDATAAQKEEVPALKTKNVYVLKKNASASKLEKTLLRLGFTEVMISQMAKKAKVDPSALLMNGTDSFKQAADKQIKKLGDTIIQTAASRMVKAEYQAMDMDIGAIQQDFIIRAGCRMLLLTMGSALCAILVGLFSSRAAAGFARDLRKHVFEKVTYFSHDNFDIFNTSTLITRTTNDIQQVQMALSMSLRMVVYAPIIGIGALIHVISSQAHMTWIIGLTIIVILSMVGALFVVAMPKFKIMQTLTDRLNSIVQELLDGMMVIRAFNNQTVEQNKFDRANADITRVSLFTSRAMAMMMPVMMFIMNGSTLLILWFGSKQVDSGAIQVGSIMAFMQYAMQVIMAFLMIAAVNIMLPRANVAGNRIHEVLTTQYKVLDPDHPISFDLSQRGKVRFEHVSFQYPGASEKVLEDVNFETTPGQVTAFIGSTGSGKSSLINLVPRFYDATEGTIYVDGADIRQVTQKDLHDRIGYVPQKGILLSGTIRSNLLYANPRASEQDIRDALVISQSQEFVSKKERGVDEPISQGGTNVSGGQKQRLSIARAVIRKPEIYIFDDSFSALDFKTDAKLREALMKSCKQTNSTVLIVAQRISSILHADQILVLDEGKVVGKGTHAQLMEDCKVYQEIAYSQLSKEELAHA